MERNERNPVEGCTWWSFLTFSWLTPLLQAGVQQPMRKAPPLPAADNTLAHGTDYVRAIGDRDTVLRTLTWEFRWPLAILQLAAIMQHAIGLTSPLIMKRILVFQEMNNKKDTLEGAVESSALTTGLLFIQIWLGVEIFRIFFGNQVQFYKSRVNIRMHAALASLVLHRSIHRWGAGEEAPGTSSTAKSAKTGQSGSDGAIYNVLAADVGAHINAIFVVMGAWLWPFTITTAAWLLYREIGPAAYPGVAAMVFLQLVYLALDTANGLLRQPYMEAKDERMSRLSECFVHVRSLRVNSWRDPMAQHVQAARDTEMSYLAAREYMTSVQGGLGYVHATLVTLVVFYFFLKNPSQSFKASLVLPVIGMLAQVNGPIGSVPNWVRTFLEYKNAAWRMRDYITAGREDRERLRHREGQPLVSVNAEFRRAEPAGDGASDLEGALLAPAFQLRAALDVHPGDVVLVTGPTASGKTMLLHALLGEVKRERGVVRAPWSSEAEEVLAPREPETLPVHDLHTGAEEIPYVDAAVTYCPQTPWVFSGTVQENILFGAPLDPDLYDSVKEACALAHDISTFPEGDDTEIGASTISGGQKTRIALARCVYRALLGGRRPVLVLLDDPLRSVDSRVGRHIASALLGENGLLRRREFAVIWTTGGAVPQGVEAGARVLLMEQGAITEERRLTATEAADDASSGGGSDAGTRAPVPAALLVPRSNNPQDDSAAPPPKPGKPRARSPPKILDEKYDKGKGDGKVRLFTEEKANTGYVGLSTYVRYSSLVGHGAMTVILISIGGIMISQQICDLFLAYWTDEKPDKNFMHPWFTEPIGPLSPVISGPGENKTMFRIYLSICCVFIFFNFAGFLLEVWGGLRAARTTFASALHGCLRRPLLWWDTNPTGRVLNRFQGDQNVVDMTITRIVGVITGALYYFVGRAFFLGVVNPISILVLIPTIAALEYFAAKLFRANIRESQRMLLMAHSPYYNSIIEQLRGQVTVRAFGAHQPAVLSLMVQLSHVQKVQFFQQSLQSWLGLRLAAISFLLGASSTLYPVLQYYGFVPPQSAGLIGFSIMYSQQLEGILSQLIHNFSEMETQLVSLERLAELADAPADRRAPLPGVGKDVVVTNLSVRYRPELPYALRGASFRIAPEEKVAIVGRTGSGKSSLMLCLLGQIPHEGDVLLGGVRVNGANVSNRIGLVPQDAVMFRGSLRFNLDPSGTYRDAQMWEALRAAGLASRVEEMRGDAGQGLDIPVEGDTFSAAEAQQLGLARVLLRNLDVVLLDEVTSCLGSAAAERILTLMWQALEGKTVLMVTHQLDLVKWCSRSIVLDKGQIVHDAPIVA